MTALVTGASGFLGSRTAAALCARGGDVRVLVRPTSDRRRLESLPVEYAEGVGKPGRCADSTSSRSGRAVASVPRSGSHGRLKRNRPIEAVAGRWTAAPAPSFGARRAGVSR